LGAINGAAIAVDPTPEGAHCLFAIWDALAEDGVLDGSLIRRVAGVADMRRFRTAGGLAARFSDQFLFACRTFRRSPQRALR
jgi:hypothetical protein